MTDEDYSPEVLEAPADSDDAVQPRGVLQRLQQESSQQVKRTIARLHRNLGHPTNAELSRLLRQKNATEAMVYEAENFHCQTCLLHHRKPQVPVSSVPRSQSFNERVQADTLWIKVDGFKRALPILMISDTATRYVAGRLLHSEQPQEFIAALERGWVRTFGPMKCLQIDDHRSWASEQIKMWASEHGIELLISPGQSHTRLSTVERQHQVTRRSLELFLHEYESQESQAEKMITALCHVLPQMNRSMNVHGYSPVQWVLGYTPHIPGLLTDEPLTPSALDPSDEFLSKLKRQRLAAKVVFDADLDTRLRRALLRKFTGQVPMLELGDRCYYYRGGPGGIGPKLRWKGPARVVMKEPSSSPHTTVYWIVHGTNLLRAAPEHLRAMPDVQEHVIETEDPYTMSQKALQQVRNRGTTLFIDLIKSNKRARHEVSSADEEEEFDRPEGDGQEPEVLDVADFWQVSDDQKTWTRVHNVPRKILYVPPASEDIPLDRFRDERVTSIRREPPHPEHLRLRDSWRSMDADRSLRYWWTGTSTFVIDEQSDVDTIGRLFQPGDTPDKDENDDEGQDPPALPPLPPPEETKDTKTTDVDAPAAESESSKEAAAVPEVPEHQRELYENKPNETFDRQETQSFLKIPRAYGPVRGEPEESSRTAPYLEHPRRDLSETMDHQIEVDLTEGPGMTELPPGWKIENGWLTLDEPEDEWRLEGNWLVYNHYVPRHEGFKPTKENCPIDPSFLAKDRVTVSSHGVFHDRWQRGSKNKQLEQALWTGQTKFKVKATWRQKAQEDFSATSKGFKSYRVPKAAAPATKKKGKDQVSEKFLNVADRLAFLQAKKKELESFFQNQVWVYDDEKNAPADRVLKAHFILNWKKNPDGTPRAKARLITQGFKDPDALSGSLTTNAPTLTRLSRSMILSTCAMFSWRMFTSDITTAFLQGKNFSPESSRVIWIRLPRDAKELLGLSPDSPVLMKLVKPMYGLCDAPRAWFEEASERIIRAGKGNIVQHPLDACLLMTFHPLEQHEVEGETPFSERRLAALFGLHVDDLLGCGDPADSYFQEVKKTLQEVFTFREWQDKETLEYCGSQIQWQPDGSWKIDQQEYMRKQKPISIAADRAKHPQLEVTDRERSLLRGLLEALQWPSTQTAPHLQAETSMLAGQTSKATIATLQAANKHLRFAKENSDVGLQYRYVGEKNEVTFIVYSDASFGCRADYSSQGGFMLAMCNADVANGKCEGYYNVIDWRSWKLPRVARSTLSAEAQAACEATDSLMYACIFWNLLWQPYLPLNDIQTGKMENPPKLVIDAKALYDVLTKEEIQAASSADKRTTIEALVCQDKLACCGGKTMWVSSELQYADGLTKNSAALLLAQRLRSHMTKLKSDESFQAAKKKNAEQRKQNAERYAIRRPEHTPIRRPERAPMALIWSLTVGISYATEEIADSEENHILNYVILIAMFMGILLWKFIGMIASMALSMNRSVESDTEEEPEPNPFPNVRNSETQTSEESALENLEALIKSLEAENARLREQNAPAALGVRQRIQNFRNSEDENARLRAENRELRAKLDQTIAAGKSWKEACEKVKSQRDDWFKSKMEATLQKTAMKPIFMSRHGACWHTSRQCVRERTANEVFVRHPCKACSHVFLTDPEPQVPLATHRSTLTGDAEASSSTADF